MHAFLLHTAKYAIKIIISIFYDVTNVVIDISMTYRFASLFSKSFKIKLISGVKPTLSTCILIFVKKGYSFTNNYNKFSKTCAINIHNRGQVCGLQIVQIVKFTSILNLNSSLYVERI